MASGKRKAAGQAPLQEATSLAGRELDDAICRICQDYLTDPVTIECGHNFCQGCITQHCAGEKTASCPRCGERFQERAFRPNTLLGSLVQPMKQMWKRRRREGVCAEHGKALEWSCKKDGKALCEDCKGSPAHCGHTVVPMGKAALETKGKASTSDRSDNGTAAISTQQQEPRAMGSAQSLRQILEEVACPICWGFFKDPVSMDCGHDFCRVCITQHCKKKTVEREGVLCPQCRKNINKENFQTNMELAIMVEKIQQLGMTPKDLKQQPVCRQHENKRKLFCEDEGEVICLVCNETQEHRSHKLVSIEEAEREYKVKLQEDMELLKKARGEISKLESMEQNKPKDWREKVKRQRQQILSEFEKLQLLQEEKKKLLLQRLEEEEKETLQRLQENVTKLSQQSSSLQQLIVETEKKCQQPATELLQDVKGTLARSEQARRQKPELSAAELKAAYRVPGMLEMLREFTVDVTLDPDTANLYLVLSEDRKRVRLGDTRQDLPDNPERFENYPMVLGAEGFAGGRRYWEVEVGDKTEWDLGVCRESVSRKGQVTLSTKQGFWAMSLRSGDKYTVSTSPWTPLPMSARPSRVGVLLDYEAGEVSFYNVTDGSHLFTFIDTFSGTLRPYFCPCNNAGGTNAAPLTICPVPAQARGNPCP